MDKSYFLFHYSWVDAMTELSHEECGRLVLAIAEYIRHDIEPPRFEGAAKAIAGLIFYEISRKKRDRERQIMRREKQENVQDMFFDADKSVTRTVQERDKNVTRNVQELQEKVKEGEKEKEKEKRTKKEIEKAKDQESPKEILPPAYAAPKGATPTEEKVKRFVKPTLEEVREYCRSRNNSVDAERFISYYESNGWRVGRNPMKDWKAAVRTWERGGAFGAGRGQAADDDTSWNPFLAHYKKLEAEEQTIYADFTEGTS